MVAPVHDPALVDGASRVLAAVPGGPSLGEARRRLCDGLPLIVGLSRVQTEELQGRLVDLGLFPRLGPAPEGTAPLGVVAGTSVRRSTLLALLGSAALVLILLRTWSPVAPRLPPLAVATAQPPGPVRKVPIAPRVRARSQPPVREPAPETVPAELRLELWARVQTVGAGLLLEGWARVRTASPPPAGPLTLIGRAGGTEVLSESLPESAAHTQRARGVEPTAWVTRTLPFRVSLRRDRVGAARELVLEGTWDAWRSEPLRIEIPGG